MNPFNIFKYVPHFLRRKFDEKFIIIESDDWGMERLTSEQSLRWLKNKFGEDKLTRWSFDSLETADDLNKLFDVLDGYKNKFEFPPVITANFITHNIDYSEKEFLNFIPLSKRSDNGFGELKKLYKRGIEQKYIYPQLHGFSHYDLSKLRNYFATQEGREAFNNNFLSARSTTKGYMSFLQGELSSNNAEADKAGEAANEFRKIFGFYSGSIIPPTYIFDISLIKLLKENNISLVQSSNRLRNTKKQTFKFPYFHKRKGIFWSVRNARLDPHPDYEFYSEQCIESIKRIFDNKSPAVIDFHRVNFAGRYAPEYRERTLKELKNLLDNIHNKWPDARFIHTQEFNNILWQQEIK